MKGLYLGDQESAADIDQIKKHKITHILSMIGGKPIFEVYLQTDERFKYQTIIMNQFINCFSLSLTLLGVEISHI